VYSRTPVQLDPLAARRCAGQVGNERALADVLHMQTTHHLSYAELEEGAYRAFGMPADAAERNGYGVRRELATLCLVSALS